MSKVGRPRKPLTLEQKVLESAKSVVNSLPPLLSEKIDGVMDEQIAWTESVNRLWTGLRSDGVTEDYFIGDPDSEGEYPVLSVTSLIRLEAAVVKCRDALAIKAEGRRAGGQHNAKRCQDRRKYIAEAFPQYIRMGIDGSRSKSNLAHLVIAKWQDAECLRPSFRTLRADLSALIKKLAKAS